MNELRVPGKPRILLYYAICERSDASSTIGFLKRLVANQAVDMVTLKEAAK